MEFFDLARRMAERLYSLPPFQRLGLIREVIALARAGNPALRRLLTHHLLLRPDPNPSWLFHRRAPAVYLTIAQAADRYCRRFWGHRVADVVSGRAPEPPSGEVSPHH